MLTPLTLEVKGEMLERTSHFVFVAAENVGGNEPLDEAVAASFNNCVVFGLQINLKGDAGIVEFVRTAAVLRDLLAAKEGIADCIRGALYETIRLLRGLTVEDWGSV